MTSMTATRSSLTSGLRVQCLGGAHVCPYLSSRVVPACVYVSDSIVEPVGFRVFGFVGHGPSASSFNKQTHHHMCHECEKPDFPKPENF